MPDAKNRIAIVGGGVVGLGIAYAAAKRGFHISLYEREERAVGASIRNFGMIWPIGQALGKAFERSMKSRVIWQELAEEAGFWYEAKGSLLLARRQDEWELAQEFCHSRKDAGYQLHLCSKKEVSELSSVAKMDGLLGGLFSGTEMIVDPREANMKTTALLREKYGVDIHFKNQVDSSRLLDLTKEFDHVFIASGTDLETLFPEVLLNSGMTKVKLQMMATPAQPRRWRMGPAIYGGLTLQHYQSYAHCQLLDRLKARIEEETPWFNKWGIHVMMSQNGLGELIIGDTHEYGHTHDPFIKAEVNQMVLDYLFEMAQFPQTAISRNWLGTYAKLPGSIDFVANLEQNITLVNGVGGAGMTHSMGLGEEIIQTIF